MTESIGPEFLSRTKQMNMPLSGAKQGIPQPPLELPAPEDAQKVGLPTPETLTFPALDVRTAIERRETLRRYAETPLTLAELAWLLWLTQGVKQVTNRPATLRTVPSAGARHAFETYLLINQVDGLEPGLYRYLALEHKLVVANLNADLKVLFTNACLEQKQVLTSAVTFFWVAVTERMMWRYPERGYRYLFLDAGHVCQNLYLAAETIGCGVCAIDAYDDDKVNGLLGLDGEAMFAVYAASLGKRMNE